MRKIILSLMLVLSSMALSSQQSQPAESRLTLQLDNAEVSYILSLLAERPIKEAAPLFQKIQLQVQTQIQTPTKPGPGKE